MRVTNQQLHSGAPADVITPNTVRPDAVGPDRSVSASSTGTDVSGPPVTGGPPTSDISVPEVSRTEDAPTSGTSGSPAPTTDPDHADWVRRGTVRAELEAIEERTLAPWAARASRTAGRTRPEAEDPVRTCWMRDLDRITFSKAMMRAHGKTQAFIPALSEGPVRGRRGGPHIGDHFVTRATHMQHTARIAATIARALQLNEPLATAIAAGHDLGHSCFGHGGEEALEEVAPNGFDHAAQGVRLLELLEPRNLTAEVLDGIAHHSWRLAPPQTLEAMCTRYADRIAYLTADLADALRAGVLGGLHEVPAGVRRVLGETPSDMVGTLVEDVVRHSHGHPRVVQGDDCGEAMQALRDFMFERVYLRPEAVRQTRRAARSLKDLYHYYVTHPEAMPTGTVLPGDPVEQQAVDAIACMTDRYALAAWHAAFAPEGA